MGSAEGIEMAEMFCVVEVSSFIGHKEGVLWIQWEVRKKEQVEKSACSPWARIAN
jgi:hypothetical protein